jgi:hypothetical protein
MVNVYGNEIIENGGELSISDNGDIIVTRNTEELYSGMVANDNFISKDWYFMNMSSVERELMSSYEYAN